MGVNLKYATGLIAYLATISIIGIVGGHLFAVLSVDRFWPHAEDIYRVESGADFAVGRSTNPIHAWAAKDFPITPEILKSQLLSELGENRITVARLKAPEFVEPVGLEAHAEPLLSYAADSGLPSVFSFRVLAGNINEALETPGGIVLTATSASQLFDGQPLSNLIGQGIIQKHGRNSIGTVKAIVATPSSNTHFNFDMLRAFQPSQPSTKNNGTGKQTQVLNNITYLRVMNESPVAIIRDALSKIIVKDNVEDEYSLIPITDIYYAGIPTGGKSGNLLVDLGLAGFLIVLLLFALFSQRLYENTRFFNSLRLLGLKKVYGLSNRRLIVSHTLFHLGLSGVIGVTAATIMLVLELMEYTNRYTSVYFYGAAAILTLLTFAIFFVATPVSERRIFADMPSKVMRFEVGTAQGAGPIQQILYIVQSHIFSFSFVLIAMLYITLSNTHALATESDLQSKLAVSLLPNGSASGKTQDSSNSDQLFNAYLSKLGSQKKLKEIAYSSQIFPSSPPPPQKITLMSSTGYVGASASVISISPGFLDIASLKLLTGRDFDPSRSQDTFDSSQVTPAYINVIVSRNLASDLGFAKFEEIIDQTITIKGFLKGRVIGVVEDANFSLTSNQGDRLLFISDRDQYQVVSVIPHDMSVVQQSLDSFASQNFLKVRHITFDQQLVSLLQDVETITKYVSIIFAIALIILILLSINFLFVAFQDMQQELGISYVFGRSKKLIYWDFLNRYLVPAFTTTGVSTVIFVWWLYHQFSNMLALDLSDFVLISLSLIITISAINIPICIRHYRQISWENFAERLRQ